MRLVVIESPYSGDVQRNTDYARACMAHCLKFGDAPIASHLLYTQPGILDDTIPAEREKGMFAGWAWIEKANLVKVYIDHGVSVGMICGIGHALKNNVPVEFWRLQEDFKEFSDLAAHYFVEFFKSRPLEKISPSSIKEWRETKLQVLLEDDGPEICESFTETNEEIRGPNLGGKQS